MLKLYYNILWTARKNILCHIHCFQNDFNAKELIYLRLMIQKYSVNTCILLLLAFFVIKINNSTSIKCVMKLKINTKTELLRFSVRLS